MDIVMTPKLTPIVNTKQQIIKQQKIKMLLYIVEKQIKIHKITTL